MERSHPFLFVPTHFLACVDGVLLLPEELGPKGKEYIGVPTIELFFFFRKKKKLLQEA
jgi:hypothetical protein